MFLLVFNSFLETNLHLKFPSFWTIEIYPLVICYIAIENGTFMVDYLRKIVIFHRVAREIHLFLGNIRQFWVFIRQPPELRPSFVEETLPFFYNWCLSENWDLQKNQWISDVYNCITHKNGDMTSHLSNRKNPGNTKYVFDGHWFMEIDGNC